MEACIIEELTTSLSLWPQNTLKACTDGTLKVYLTVQLQICLTSHIGASNGIQIKIRHRLKTVLPLQYLTFDCLNPEGSKAILEQEFVSH